MGAQVTKRGSRRRQHKRRTAGGQNDRGPIRPISSAQQIAAANTFQRRRGTPVFGPFLSLLHHPTLMLAAERVGATLRYGGCLPARVRELVILVTARAWNQATEWRIHAPLALQAGISQRTITAIAAGRRPQTLAGDEAVAFDFARQIQRQRRVSARCVSMAKATFDEIGVVELAALCGYYALLAMIMNTAGEPSGHDLHVRQGRRSSGDARVPSRAT
jgi:4-carboxymuconolactone decarboxylase